MVESQLVQETQTKVTRQQTKEGSPTSVESLSLPYAAMLPYYQKWLSRTFPDSDPRSMQKKCATVATMLITTKYLSADHPFGHEDKHDKKEYQKALEKAKSELQEKERVIKEKVTDKVKDKKDKKHKKDKDDKKGKKDKKKDKDDKDKKDKKDKKSKDGKDKKDKLKEVKDETVKKAKEVKDKAADKVGEVKDKLSKEDKKKAKELKKAEDPEHKSKFIKTYLRSRDERSLSSFSPCMSFVKCPSGAEGDECTALKRAARASLSADRCWFNYLSKLEKCDGDKACVRKISAAEQACMHHLVTARDQANRVLNSDSNKLFGDRTPTFGNNSTFGHSNTNSKTGLISSDV